MRQFNVETGIFGNLNVGSSFVVDDQGNVGNVSPASGQVIFWNGTNWIPSSVSGVSAEGGGSSVADPFVTSLSPSGQSEYFIAFAETYSTAPAIATDLEITGAGSIIPYAISSVSTSGYNVSFAEDIPDNDYRIHTVFGGSAGGAGGGDSFWEATSSSNISYTGGLDIDGGLNFSGHILPAHNAQYDIGSAEYKIRHLYLSDNSLYIGDSQLSVKEDGSMDFPQGITTSGNIYTTKDVIVDGDLDFNTVGGTSASEANDVIKWNGSKWVAAAPTTLGLGGSSASTEVPDSFVDNVPQGTTVHPVTYGPFDSTPRIASTVEVDGDGGIVPYTISGVSETGYHVVFSEAIQTPNYRVHTVFGGKDVYWKTGANALSYTENNVDISRNLYVGQNVGIGTTNPDAPLTVVEAGNVAFKMLKSDNSNLFTIGEDGANSTILSSNRSGGGLIFKTTDSTSTNESMRILSSGNVGIGTTNPAVKLEVVNSASSNIAQFSSTSSNLGGYILIQGSSEAGSTGNLFIGNGRPLVTGSSDASAAIRASTELLFSIGAVEKMRINSDGNVGIGVKNPGARLQVKAANGGDVHIHTNNITNRGSYTLAGAGATPTDENSFEIGPGYINLNRDDTNTIKQIQFGKNGAVAGYIETHTNTTNYAASSDYRLKENVVAIDGAIERINKLKPCRFNFIKTPEIVVDGFIAHEVQEIVPEAISGEKDAEDENGNIVPQGIDQGKLVPLLTAAIQEQQQIIEHLKSQNESLAAQNADFESRISKLEQ